MGDVQPRLHIPRQSTRYFGRNAEVRHVFASFESNTRLVTLIGTGGIGKTRLALEIGVLAYPRFPAGVFLIELARISDPKAVPSVIAATLGIQLQTDSHLPIAIQDSINQPLLLILDNCEHLIDTCASLTQHLIEDTEWVSVLATSRERLSIKAEQLLPLAPMTVPSDTESDIAALLSTESVQLFVDRAQRQNPLFQMTSDNASAIRDICRRLDGIPLAIELAAAHVPVLSPLEILGRMNNRFTLLKGSYRGVIPRQQTLRALFDWSYDLLTEREQLLWQRLSIFSPGFSLRAVQEVVPDEHLPKDEVLDTLMQLVHKSILTGFLEHGVMLYQMLETLREYGREKLAQTREVDLFQHRHKDYYANQMRQLVDNMFNNPAQIIAEFENVTEALEYALDSGDSASAMIISVILAFYSHARGTHNAYNYESLKRANESADVNDFSRDRALALVGIGFLARALNRIEEAVLLLQQAVRVARESKDGFALEFSLTHLALALPHIESKQKIETLNELLDITDNWISITNAHSVLSQHYLWHRETSMALRHATHCVEVAKDHQETFYYALALGTLGTVELAAQAPQKALKALETAVNFMGDTQHVIGLCDYLLPLARTYQLLGQSEKAVQTLLRALHLQVNMDLNNFVNDKSVAWIGWAYIICADFHLRDKIQVGTHLILNEMNWQPKHLRDRCATIVAESQQQYCDMDTSTESHNLSRKQWVQLLLSDFETRSQDFKVDASSDVSPDRQGVRGVQEDHFAANRFFQQAEALTGDSRHDFLQTAVIMNRGELAMAQRDWEQALEFFTCAKDRFQKFRSVIHVVEALIPLAYCEHQLGDCEKSYEHLEEALSTLVSLNATLSLHQFRIVAMLLADYEKYSTAVSLWNVNTTMNRTSVWMIHIGQIFLNQAKTTLGEESYEAAVKRGKETRLPELTKDAYAAWRKTKKQRMKGSPVSGAYNGRRQTADTYNLTERELEVLTVLAKGYSNRQVASELFLTEGTIRTYLSRVYGKLGVSSRTEALMKARQLRLIDD